jgi:hypothetical protein
VRFEAGHRKKDIAPSYIGGIHRNTGKDYIFCAGGKFNP